MLDISFIRSQFPILETKIRDKYPLVYLDNAATTQKPFAVINSLLDYYTRYNANVHRGVHYLSSLATDMYEKSRQTVCEFINASSKDEIIFTRGTTESINLLAESISRTVAKRGSGSIFSDDGQGKTDISFVQPNLNGINPNLTEIKSHNSEAKLNINEIKSHNNLTQSHLTDINQSIGYEDLQGNKDRKSFTVMITQMEHHSNIVPWQLASQEKGIILDYLTFDGNGELENVKEKILQTKPDLLSLCHISNTLGTVNPVKEIISFCHQHGTKVLIDGAQAVSHTFVDVQDLDADFYVFSGHKVYAPMGIGVLYGKKHLLDQLSVYQGGGEMIKEVTMEKTTFNDLPYKFEAGTPSVADAIGLATALSWFKSMDMNAIFEHEDYLFNYTRTRLQEMKQIRIFGNAKHKSSCISFLAEGIHHLDLGTLLDAMGVAIRTGHHCAEPVMQKFNIEGTDRISFAAYTTKEDIDMFFNSLNKALTMLS